MKRKTRIWHAIIAVPVISLIIFIISVSGSKDNLRTMKYTSRSEKKALIWQSNLRTKLFKILKMDDFFTDRENIALNPKVIRCLDKGKYLWKEIEFNSTFHRRIKVIYTVPKLSGTDKKEKVWPAVVCIHGHGGRLESVYDRNSIYKGFASELAVNNYVTISAYVSQHIVFERGRIIMGERLWDLMRCVDYLESCEEVDKNRIGCGGLSLGGEMAMWLGAMDKRIKATVSSGFLTKMDQLEINHCMCWKFPGLRKLVDFADIYSLIAPRQLMCQNGLKEPVTDFTVPIARQALKEVKAIYTDFNKPENVVLVSHEGAHEINLPSLMAFFDKHLGMDIK